MRYPEDATNPRRLPGFSALRFVFAIPLKPRSACVDWNRAQENLRRTIKSALAASAGLPAAVWVACHDEPDLGVFRDAVQLCHVPFSEPVSVPEGGPDKARKRRFLAACLREYVDDDVTVMFLDADDLVHRDIVRYALGDGRGSYVIDQGYVYDVRQKILQRYPADFHRRCGSSFIFRFSPDELTTSYDDVDARFSMFGTSPAQRGHQDYGVVATELGRPPVPVPFPACVYLVNHEESLWAAETGGAVRLNQRPFDIIAPREARRIVRDAFSSDEVAAEIAGAPGFLTATFAALLVAARIRVLRLFGRRPKPIRQVNAASFVVGDVDSVVVGDVDSVAAPGGAKAISQRR